MTMRYRETDALLREAESRDNLAAALKGGTAAKEFRKEREALEKAAGGKKKLDEADKYHAKRIAEGDAYFAERKQAGDDIENEVAAEIGQRTSALTKLEHEARERATSAKEHSLSVTEREKALVKRTHLVADREEVVLKAESVAANLKESLEGTQARLANWEQALDVRAARFKEAAA